MDKAAAKVKEASMARDESDRAARLAEALRSNLRRRKAQARAAAPAAEPTPAPIEPAAAVLPAETRHEG